MQREPLGLEAAEAPAPTATVRGGLLVLVVDMVAEEALVTWPGLTPPYRTLIVDAPWRYHQTQRHRAHVARQYSTLSLAELQALPVSELAADDAHLWRPNGCTMGGHMRVPGRRCNDPRRGQHGGADMAKRMCSVEGCGRTYYGRGWCKMHYQRWRARGVVGGAEPESRRAPNGADPAERFWSFVDTDGPVAKNRPDLGLCFLWTGAVDRDGYGRFKVRSQHERSQYAHRWAYEEFVGPVPDGMVLDHFACDNPPCCNWTHVHPTTNEANLLRGNGIAVRNARKSHCPAGHPYDEFNTYRNPRTGSRQCIACRRIREGYGAK